MGGNDPCADGWLKGTARAHMWKGQGWLNRYAFLPDNDETHMAAQISGTLKIKQGQIFSWWFLDLPPDDVNIGAELAFGAVLHQWRLHHLRGGHQGQARHPRLRCPAVLQLRPRYLQPRDQPRQPVVHPRQR